MKDFKGRTAFVTGGGSGIGLELGRSLAQRGSNVMLADIDTDRLDAARDSLQQIHDGIDVCVCDVADAASVYEAAQATVDRFGKVHLLMNNAGVGLSGHPGTIALEDWRWVVDINLMGVVHGVEIFTPLIREHGEGGHIVNTASMAGHMAAPQMSPYNATKFAVVGLSETIRQDLAAENIGVSVLCPGWVKTDIYNSHKRQPSGARSSPAASNSTHRDSVVEAIENGMAADLVARWTLECIEYDRFYIFTHPEFAPPVAARAQMIEADYAACAADPRFTSHGTTS